MMADCGDDAADDGLEILKGSGTKESISSVVIIGKTGH